MARQRSYKDCQVSLEESNGNVESTSNQGLGEPIQILKDPENLEIDQAALRRVLCHPDVGNKPISVVSAVGAYRAGKSFLMNYFLRYLENRGYESGRENLWVGNDNQPLKGFSWGGGCELKTTGILIWSKPFVIKRQSGEIAVFIVDTQGSFDLKSNRKVFCNVFMLTLLMSSCTVYNLKNVFGQNVLEYLEFCVGYSKMANKNKDLCSSLQNFCFLLRDWQDPYNYDYGLSGGQKYLEEKILALGTHGNEKKLKDLNKIRSELRNSVDSLDCYLMPSPGHKATISTERNDFNGELKDLQPEFVEHLKILCHNILHPYKLLEKRNMNGNMLANFIIEVCEHARKHPDCELSMESLLSAAIHSRCTEVLVKLINQYRQEVNEKTGDISMKTKLLREILDSQEQEMRGIFFKEIGVPQNYIDECEKKFTRSINEVNKEIEANNDRLWMIENGKLADISQRIWAKYQKKMCEAKNLECSWDMDEINKYHEDYLRKAQEDFDSQIKMMGQREDSEIEATKKSLMEGIDCTHRLMILEFKCEKAKDVYTERNATIDSEENYKEEVQWENSPMLKALGRRYDEVVKQETGERVSSNKKLDEIKKKFTSQTISVFEACLLETETPDPEYVSVEQWKAAIDAMAQKHKRLNTLRESKTKAEYFDLTQQILEEIKKEMTKTENINTGKLLLEHIDENLLSYLDKCTEFTKTNYMTSDDEVQVPKFSDQIVELCDIWKKLINVQQLLFDVKFHQITKEIELQYLNEIHERISGSDADVDELLCLHEDIAQGLLNERDGREAEILNQVRCRIEKALNDQHSEIKKYKKEESEKFLNIISPRRLRRKILELIERERVKIKSRATIVGL